MLVNPAAPANLLHLRWQHSAPWPSLHQRCVNGTGHRTASGLLQRVPTRVATSTTLTRAGLNLFDEFHHLAVELPSTQHTRTRSARFVKSSARVADCPSDGLPEFAVIGRSNVGKSSLINMLSEIDKMAKISKEPGQTKLINHYLLNNSWYLVDLPGYGFARASWAERQQWIEFTQDYFLRRDNLMHVLLLVDASLPSQPVDIQCAQWLAECEVPFAIVFTKLDLRKRDGPLPAANVRAFKAALAQEWEALPLCFETSAQSGLGRSELQGYMAGLRALHTQSGETKGRLPRNRPGRFASANLSKVEDRGAPRAPPPPPPPTTSAKNMSRSVVLKRVPSAAGTSPGSGGRPPPAQQRHRHRS